MCKSYTWLPIPYKFAITCTGLNSTVSASDYKSRGRKFEFQLSHTSFLEIDSEIISAGIPSNPIQGGQLSVTGDSMCISTT